MSESYGREVAKAHAVDFKSFVTIYYNANHPPTNKLNNVNYVEMSTAIKMQLNKKLRDKKDIHFSLELGYSEKFKSYVPAVCHKDLQIVGVAVVSVKKALNLLNRSQLNHVSSGLIRSILWSANSQSYCR